MRLAAAMDRDYLLIAVDKDRKYAIRFLSFSHCAAESLVLQKPQGELARVYLEFILAGTILGSRADEQESILFKLQFQTDDLSLNCEINPRGALRSAIFPADHKVSKPLTWDGILKVVTLKKSGDAYESVVEIVGNSVEDVIGHYLKDSVQTASLLCLHGDSSNAEKNYALWIEKLPGTSDAEWEKFSASYRDGTRFNASFSESDDPDVIVKNLFDDPITILAVTKPNLTCSCSKQKVIDALKLLPVEDLTDIFMAGQGVSTQCDYCRRVWEIEDEDVKKMLGMGKTVH